jgi:hypothetical protein
MRYSQNYDAKILTLSHSDPFPEMYSGSFQFGTRLGSGFHYSLPMLLTFSHQRMLVFDAYDRTMYVLAMLYARPTN